MKILLIEDDRNLSDSICEVLKRRRMDVDAVYDGEDGLAQALSANPDLMARTGLPTLFVMCTTR